MYLDLNKNNIFILKNNLIYTTESKEEWTLEKELAQFKELFLYMRNPCPIVNEVFLGKYFSGNSKSFGFTLPYVSLL